MSQATIFQSNNTYPLHKAVVYKIIFVWLLLSLQNIFQNESFKIYFAVLGLHWTTFSVVELFTVVPEYIQVL